MRKIYEQERHVVFILTYVHTSVLRAGRVEVYKKTIIQESELILGPSIAVGLSIKRASYETI